MPTRLAARAMLAWVRERRPASVFVPAGRSAIVCSASVRRSRPLLMPSSAARASMLVCCSV
ncbi:hypothetical protein ACWEU6_08305 [Streptosporangium sandarakinum]|uniref:hypothetical protein n=1 Tax=Streptosporangium sandarakinum TaxID=1260955 RepID=UPI0036736569